MKDRSPSSETLIYDTGRVPVWLCLLITPFGLVGLWGSTQVPFLQMLLVGGFSLFMLSMWIWRTRAYHDATRQQIVMRHPLHFGLAWRIPLEGATAIYLRDVRVLTSAVVGVDLGILYD